MAPMGRGKTVTLDDVEVPRVVGETVAWLRSRGVKSEGLFRARANMARVQFVKQLYDKDDADPLREIKDPHVVAGVLKLYLAALPEPVLSFKLCKGFLATQAITNRTHRLSTLRTLLHSVCESSFNVMRVLLPLLHNVCMHSRQKDNAAQLAAMFSPLFIRNKDARVYGIVEDVKRADSVVQEMISECAFLLTEPEPLPVSNASAKDASGVARAHQPKTSRASDLRLQSGEARSPSKPNTCPRAAGEMQPSTEEYDLINESVASSVDTLFEGTPSFDLEVDRILGGALGHMYYRPLREMTKEELQTEKSAVKRKLRAYDAYFLQRFGRKPERNDKEHLRRLYIRYYKLKCNVNPGKEKTVDVDLDDPMQADFRRAPLAEKSGNVLSQSSRSFSGLPSVEKTGKIRPNSARATTGRHSQDLYAW
uniref:Rho-GAP domain-containing protein n=1 Tax=Pyramimonas obovata TaxID=1411642 RepID=A0A7S0RJL0_9CHLO|mmetsp:Transcript_36107/g.78786  ORF Transcript_36107/g.78786 Transcript_36107/m.78786 type:complete len:423 (+) Transcript_36107:72-1340(+)